VVLAGRVFTVSGQLHCASLATGGTLWSGGRFGHGSCLLTAGDRKLLVFGEGTVALIDPLADRYAELARVEGVVPGICYPHLALANGLLAAKDRDGNLVCFDLTRRAPPPPSPPLEPLFEWRRGRLLRGAGGLDLRGSAAVTPDRYLELTGGAALASAADGPLLEACRQTHELSIEVVLAPATLRQEGPARIVSFSLDPMQRNFTLGQERARLILRLRTPQTGDNGMNPQTELCELRNTDPVHVLITYSPGRLVCYVNGARVHESDAVQGGFTNWTAGHLILGDEWSGGRPWRGALECVTIYARALSAEEAAARWEEANR
jgi:hypothetical protein